MKRMIFLMQMVFLLSLSQSRAENGIEGERNSFQPSANLLGSLDVRFENYGDIGKRKEVLFTYWADLKSTIVESNLLDEFGGKFSFDFFLSRNLYVSTAVRGYILAMDSRDIRNSVDIGLGYRKISNGNEFYALAVPAKLDYSTYEQKGWYVGFEGGAYLKAGDKGRFKLVSEVNNYPKWKTETEYSRFTKLPVVGSQILFVRMKGIYYFNDLPEWTYGIAEDDNLRIELELGMKFPL